jgi:sugar lactone lactonase YvrE
MKRIIRVLSAAVFFVSILQACKKSSTTSPVISGTVTTIAGNGTPGFADGNGSSAQFNIFYRIAIDGQDNIYVADAINNSIRKITQPGNVTTVAGTGVAGYVDGNIANAEFNNPVGIAFDVQGDMYISDAGNNVIRKITSSGIVSTLAGNGIQGFADGAGVNAEFNGINEMVTDAQGNIYVVEGGNNRIRKITPSGIVSTLAGNGIQGFADGAAASAEFNTPFGIAIDKQGNIYVGDNVNVRIRKITPAGMVSTIAQVNNNGISVDAEGNVYVGDASDNVIDKITPAGVLSTFAGNGIAGLVDGTLLNAEFNSPRGSAVDSKGNIYVADEGNYSVRKITLH